MNIGVLKWPLHVALTWWNFAYILCRRLRPEDVGYEVKSESDPLVNSCSFKMCQVDRDELYLRRVNWFFSWICWWRCKKQPIIQVVRTVMNRIRVLIWAQQGVIKRQRRRRFDNYHFANFESYNLTNLTRTFQMNVSIKVNLPKIIKRFRCSFVYDKRIEYW